MVELHLVPTAASITSEGFREMILEEETRQTVQGHINVLCRPFPAFELSPLEDVVVVDEIPHHPQGHLGHVKSEAGITIITSTTFPETIEASTVLNEEDSVRLAALMTCAYGAMVMRLSSFNQANLFKVPTSCVTDHNESVWPDSFNRAYRVRPMPLRAAACVALFDMLRVEYGVIQIDGSPPYAPHIAALINPINAELMQGMSGIFQNSIK